MTQKKDKAATGGIHATIRRNQPITHEKYQSIATRMLETVGCRDLAPTLTSRPVPMSLLEMAGIIEQAPDNASARERLMADRTYNPDTANTTNPVTGRGRPEGPTAPTGWEAAAEQVAGEQQAPPEPQPDQDPDDGNGDDQHGDQPAPAADDGWDRAAQLVAQQMER